MDKNELVKIGLLAAGTFIVALSANLVGNAIYTNSKPNADIPVAVTIGVFGIGVSYAIIRFTR